MVLVLTALTAEGELELIRVRVGCSEVGDRVDNVCPPFEADDHLTYQLVATWVMRLRMLLALKALTEHF